MKAIFALLFLTATIVYAQLITQDHGCITSAGYSWCAFENKCVRPWELAKEKGLEMTPENVNNYCNVKKIGSSDAHGCVKSAGYSWCAKVNQCVRPWELAQAKAISIKTAQDFINYCSNSTEVGADSDNHGCLASAGYSWCKKENKCVQPWELAKELKLENTPESVHSYCADCLASAGYSWCEFEGQCIRPWELAKLKNIANTPEAVQSFCSGGPSSTHQSIGGASTSDPHGCVAGAGYTWCQTEDKCVRPWEVAQLKNIANTPEAFAQYCNNPAPIGGSSNVHNCLASAGYSWCQTENKCVRPWEVAQLKNIANTPEAFAQYCNNPSPIEAIGGQSDENGCITGAGYTWCAKENKCVQPWVLAQEKNIKDMTADSFVSYCSQE